MIILILIMTMFMPWVCAGDQQSRISFIVNQEEEAEAPQQSSSLPRKKRSELLQDIGAGFKQVMDVSAQVLGHVGRLSSEVAQVQQRVLQQADKLIDEQFNKAEYFCLQQADELLKNTRDHLEHLDRVMHKMTLNPIVKKMEKNPILALPQTEKTE